MFETDNEWRKGFVPKAARCGKDRYSWWQLSENALFMGTGPVVPRRDRLLFKATPQCSGNTRCRKEVLGSPTKALFLTSPGEYARELLSAPQETCPTGAAQFVSRYTHTVHVECGGVEGKFPDYLNCVAVNVQTLCTLCGRLSKGWYEFLECSQAASLVLNSHEGDHAYVTFPLYEVYEGLLLDSAIRVQGHVFNRVSRTLKDKGRSLCGWVFCPARDEGTVFLPCKEGIQDNLVSFCCPGCKYELCGRKGQGVRGAAAHFFEKFLCGHSFDVLR